MWGSGLSLCSGSRKPKASLEPPPRGCVPQNSVSILAEPANMSAQYRALEGAGRRFAMPRPGLGPLRWQPRAWPGLPSQARS